MDAFLEFYAYLQQFSLIGTVVRLLVAAVLGGLVGFERERHGRAAGLRTHILVCLGSATAVLVGHYGFAVLGFDGDPLRIGAQVLSGIGFLGAGTIISRGRFQVTGLTTAACLWTTASIGLAVGIGFYEAAVLVTVIVVLTMSLLTKFDASIDRHNHKMRVYIELDNVEAVNGIIAMLTDTYRGKNTQVTGPRSTLAGHCGIECTLHVENEKDGKQILQSLIEHEHIVFALPSV